MISVAIGTCNGEKYIREQLNSILNQSIKPDEILISDDASTDNTVYIAEDILRKSNVVFKIINNKSRLGVAKNFENCFRLCSGDIIFSSDQDDIWMPNKIEYFLEIFENEEIVYAYSDGIVVDESRRILKESLLETRNDTKSMFNNETFSNMALCGNFPHGCTIAFRKKILDYIPDFLLLHDNWIALYAPYLGKIARIDLALIEYRQHGLNASGTMIGVKNEKQKRNKRLRDKLQNNSYDVWFIWPENFERAYVKFYKDNNHKLNINDANYLEKKINFYKTLTSMKEIGKIQQILKLTNLLLNKNYFLFRGNIKMYFVDVFFLINLK